MNEPWRRVQANPQTSSFFPSFKLSLLQTWAVFNERFPPRNSAAEISSIFTRNAHEWHNWPAQSTGKAPPLIFRQATCKATCQPSHHASVSPLHKQLCPCFWHSSWPLGTPASSGTPQAHGGRPGGRHAGGLWGRGRPHPTMVLGYSFSVPAFQCPHKPLSCSSRAL